MQCRLSALLFGMALLHHIILAREKNTLRRKLNVENVGRLVLT
jgi:hypothetical protein